MRIASSLAVASILFGTAANRLPAQQGAERIIVLPDLSAPLAIAGEHLKALGPRLAMATSRLQGLDGMLAEQRVRLDAVINYDLPDSELIARLSGRRVCPGCKAVYHLRFKPPARDGICNLCQTGLEQREDDRPEAIRVRLMVYRESIVALLRYYRQQNLLVTVSAEGTPEQVFMRTLAVFTPEQVMPRAARS